MKRFISIAVYSTIILGLSTVIAISCSPNFPWQLFNNRKNTLLNLPPLYSFNQQIQQIITISETEKQHFLSSNNILDPSKKNVKTCPQSDDTYKQAAVLYQNKQWPEAYTQFAQLAYNSTPVQKICSTYTLGHIEKKLNRLEDSVQSFILTSYLVSQGAPDPLHLGISALGDAAGIILDQIGTRSLDKEGTIHWQIGPIKPDSLIQLERSINFYAKQALLGDQTGNSSLYNVLNGLTDPNNTNAKILLKQSLTSPLIRKLVVAYILNKDYEPFTLFSARKKNILSIFKEALLEQINFEDDLSNLAAFAYQNNDIDTAEHLARQDWQKQKKGLDAWVLAKISVMKGNRSKAQEYYHQAISTMHDTTIQQDERDRIQGEHATLTLAQGDYLQALEQLWPIRDIYWGDIVYLAENVLTLDELKSFTDKHTFPSNITYEEKLAYTDDYTLENRSLALRNLLARRLIREKRFKEAENYFTNSKNKNKVNTYASLYHEMYHDFWSTNRAIAAWKAAKLMFKDGMELTGTDGYPDQSPGIFAYGISQPNGPKYTLENYKFSTPDEQKRTGVSWPIPNKRFHYRYIAVDYALYAASLIPERSQAYASILCQANGWMQQSSMFESFPFTENKLVVPNSSRHVSDAKFALATSQILYNLYLKNGAYIQFAKNFGHQCPEPNFASITKLKLTFFWDNIKSSLNELKRYSGM